MKMQSSSNVTTAVGSSTATVSTPVIGDDYVLVKKSSILAEKKQEQKDKKNLPDTLLFGLAKNMFSRAGGRFGQCDAYLTYDFSFTPSTSSTVQTVVALAPNQDTSFTNKWASIFQVMAMNSAEVQFDFTQFTSTVGHDVALSPIVIGYAPAAFATTQYYADVSDWKNSKFAAYSLAKPVVRFKVPGKWMTGWNIGQEASSVGTFYNQKWAATQYVSATVHKGFVHIASQKVMFDTERVVVGRLIMHMTFKGQL
jgi:hypothetical protein